VVGDETTRRKSLPLRFPGGAKSDDRVGSYRRGTAVTKRGRDCNQDLSCPPGKAEMPAFGYPGPDGHSVSRASGPQATGPWYARTLKDSYDFCEPQKWTVKREPGLDPDNPMRATGRHWACIMRCVGPTHVRHTSDTPMRGVRRPKCGWSSRKPVVPNTRRERAVFVGRCRCRSPAFTCGSGEMPA